MRTVVFRWAVVAVLAVLLVPASAMADDPAIQPPNPHVSATSDPAIQPPLPNAVKRAIFWQIVRLVLANV